MEETNKQVLTFVKFYEELFSNNFIFENYIINEKLYPKMDGLMDILHFKEIIEMAIGHGPALRENAVELEFKNCIFDINVGFSLNPKTKFSFKRFINCEFRYPCSFLNVTLELKRTEPQEKYINFIGFFDKVVFKDLYFYSVTIKTSTLFREVSINGNLVFDECIIMPPVALLDLPIEGSVIVQGCEFMDLCRIEIPFKKNLSIYNKTLKDKTEKPNIFHSIFAFRGEIYGQFMIQKTIFKKDFLFQPIYIADKNVIFNSIEIEGSANFRNLNFNERTQFRNIDLSKCSFLYSKFDDSLFANCYLTKKKIYDEIQLSDKPDKMILTDVVNELRMFEMSFDKRKNFEQAGEFHCYALEVERRLTRWSSRRFPKIADYLNILHIPRLKKIALILYKWTSDYGENYAKSLRKIIYIIIIFSIIYLYTGLSYSNYNIWWWDNSKPNLFTDWGSSLLYSLISSSPVRRDSEVIKSLGGWTTGFSILQTIIQTILGTLFVIGIRRKFKR